MFVDKYGCASLVATITSYDPGKSTAWPVYNIKLVVMVHAGMNSGAVASMA